MTPDIRQDDFFVGRTDELYQLIRNLQRGRHTLLTGPKGIGKTRLMQEAIAALRGVRRRIELSPGLISRLTGHLAIRNRPEQYRIMFIYHSSPLGDCLKEMAGQLHAMGALRLDSTGPIMQDWPTVKKRLTGIGSIHLQDVICESVRASAVPILIFFDSLDRISPTNQMFLESLLSNAVICAAAVHMKEAFHFKKIWLSFTRIDLESLSEDAGSELISHCLSTYGIKVIDPELYRREILKSANGNPFHIKNLIWQGSRETHVTTEDIRRLRRTEEGEYFNMGPIYIFMASVLTLFKIFSIGMDNREFYIYFSALGFIVYIAFRVFRTFFLFRPQKSHR